MKYRFHRINHRCKKCWSQK